MSDVPSEIFREILRRLSADSLYRCRTVCKTWRFIIDDPSFIQFHRDNQPSPDLLIRGPTGRLYSLSLDSVDCRNRHRVIDVARVRTLISRRVPRLPEFPMASCNGLILLFSEISSKFWVIWNPLTKVHRKLDMPKPLLDGTDKYLICSGLGYDYAADDYKVVRIDAILRDGKEGIETCLFSLKSDSWKVIKNCPYGPASYGNHQSQGVYLNGALHWASWDVIVAIDLRTEEYRQLPPPPVPKPIDPFCPGNGEPSRMHFVALDGCLILSYYYWDNNKGWDGWVLRKNGWLKLFSTRQSDAFDVLRDLRPVAYLKSKEQILLQYHRWFFWLDIKENTVKKFSIHGKEYDAFDEVFSSQVFTQGLVQLNDGSGKTIAIKRTAEGKREDTWQELDFNWN